MFEKLVPGFIAMAQAAVKGPLIPDKEDKERKYSYEEEATYLKVSPRSLERAVKERRIDFVKMGTARNAKIMFTKAALDVFLDQNTRRAREKQRKT